MYTQNSNSSAGVHEASVGTTTCLSSTTVFQSLQNCHPAYVYHISREDKERIKRLQNLVVCLAFNWSLSDHVSSNREMQPCNHGSRMQDDDILPSPQTERAAVPQ